jgi:hypothetical protein
MNRHQSRFKAVAITATAVGALFWRPAGDRAVVEKKADIKNFSRLKFDVNMTEWSGTNYK